MASKPRFEKLSTEVREGIHEVTANEASEIIGKGGLLIDVRENDEFAKEHAVGARHIARGVLEMKIEEIEPDTSRPIVCYCGGGNRSALAAESLERMGYSEVSSLAGGFEAWRGAGLPVE